MFYGYSFGSYDLAEEIERLELHSIMIRYNIWRKTICSPEIRNAFSERPEWQKWKGKYTCRSQCKQYRLVFHDKSTTLYCK